MKQSRRKWCSIVMFLSLLFSQWAVAAYVCTMPASGLPRANEATDDMAGMRCGGEAPDRSALCIKHCQDDQAASQPQPPSADFQADVAILYIVPTGAIVVAHSAGRLPSAPLRRQTSPPPLLLSPRLRI